MIFFFIKFIDFFKYINEDLGDYILICLYSKNRIHDFLYKTKFYYKNSLVYYIERK
jgi:hypothetical protein